MSKRLKIFIVLLTALAAGLFGVLFYDLPHITGRALPKGEMVLDDHVTKRSLDGDELRLELSFEPMYMARIAQLTNKSNQFNLTTRRFTQPEIQEMAQDSRYVTLYGRLSDKFGDNGVVAVTAGRLLEPEAGQEAADTLDIFLWLMSCRVLKRGMEDAMLDALVATCRKRGLRRLVGHYYPTAKNRMVKDFYQEMGFTLLSEDEEGNKTYELLLSGYQDRNQAISLREGPEA